MRRIFPGTPRHIRRISRPPSDDGIRAGFMEYSRREIGRVPLATDEDSLVQERTCSSSAINASRIRFSPSRSKMTQRPCSPASGPCRTYLFSRAPPIAPAEPETEPDDLDLGFDPESG